MEFTTLPQSSHFSGIILGVDLPLLTFFSHSSGMGKNFPSNPCNTSPLFFGLLDSSSLTSHPLGLVGSNPSGPQRRYSIATISSCALLSTVTARLVPDNPGPSCLL